MEILPQAYPHLLFCCPFCYPNKMYHPTSVNFNFSKLWVRNMMVGLGNMLFGVGNMLVGGGEHVVGGGEHVVWGG